MDFKTWRQHVYRLANNRGIEITFHNDILIAFFNNGKSTEEVVLAQIAQNNCFENSEKVKNSKVCGCFYCLRIVETTKINSEDLTVRCPYCNIASLVPNVVDLDLLAIMHDVLFRTLL